MQTFSLYELHEHLRRVVALNFSEAVWINCEIAAHTESRGHHFLSLLEKGEGEREILAQADAVIWNRKFRKLRKELGRDMEPVLQSGRQVRLKVRVDFHERFGLKLMVEEIDLAYTVGQLELQKRAIIERLQAEQLIGNNARIILPKVIQRIAVLSSEQAAGWKDFEAHLQQNNFGYQFDMQLFTAAMQGVNVRTEVLKQLKKIRRSKNPFDAVVIIRGGGARLDLTAFDDYEIGAAVAQFTLPVLTGIGHEIDESILDLVAHTALKTPTAVADFILQHNAFFETQIHQHFQSLQWLARQHFQQQNIHLERLSNQLLLSNKNRFQQQKQHLHQLEQSLPKLLSLQLKTEHQRLQHLEQLSDFLSLQHTLERGFSLTMKEGKVVRSVGEVEKGEVLISYLRDGEVASEVK